jgi:hypothetical protein
MICDRIQLPDGGVAIVCSTGTRKRCSCGRRATLACDWKVPSRRSGTCDAPICAGCAEHVADDKDLCPQHSRAYAEWRARREAARRSSADV